MQNNTQTDQELTAVYGTCDVCGGPRGTWLLQGMACTRHPEHGPDRQHLQPPPGTHLRIPPAAELGEVAYRTFTTHVATLSAGSWAIWQQLADDDRHPWLMVALDVVEAVRAANEHA